MFRRGCLVPADRRDSRELVGQRGPAPGDARPHRSGRDVEHRRDLGVVEADEIAERDRGAVTRATAARARRRCRAGRRRRRRAPGRASRGSGTISDRRRSAGAAPGFVERGVRRDPVAPRRELRASVEGVDAPRDREQRFLRRVERVVGVARARGGRPRAPARRGGAAARRARHGRPRGRRGELVVAIVGLHRGQR